jgi:tetratricopeptide (TPR) repeat protein
MSGQATGYANHSKQETRCKQDGSGHATGIAARMDLHITQRTAGWITAALITCQSLCGQTGTRPALEFREDPPPAVTFQELQHRVPKEARAEMEKADRAKLKHQREQAIEHLKKAILIDPEYIAARNNLGVWLLPIEPESAIFQWEEAIKVNPRKGLLYHNLAIAYFVIHNLEGTERAARMALDLDRTANRVRAVLGLVLYEEHKYTEETCALLARASDEYAMTHVFAAQVLMVLGQMQEARTHVQAYLSSGEMEYRSHASKMLDSIDHTGQARDSSTDQF